MQSVCFFLPARLLRTSTTDGGKNPTLSVPRCVSWMWPFQRPSECCSRTWRQQITSTLQLTSLCCQPQTVSEICNEHIGLKKTNVAILRLSEAEVKCPCLTFVSTLYSYIFTLYFCCSTMGTWQFHAFYVFNTLLNWQRSSLGLDNFENSFQTFPIFIWTWVWKFTRSVQLLQAVQSEHN